MNMSQFIPGVIFSYENYMVNYAIEYWIIVDTCHTFVYCCPINSIAQKALSYQKHNHHAILRWTKNILKEILTKNPKYIKIL